VLTAPLFSKHKTQNGFIYKYESTFLK